MDQIDEHTFYLHEPAFCGNILKGDREPSKPSKLKKIKEFDATNLFIRPDRQHNTMSWVGTTQSNQLPILHPQVYAWSPEYTIEWFGQKYMYLCSLSKSDLATYVALVPKLSFDMKPAEVIDVLARSDITLGLCDMDWRLKTMLKAVSNVHWADSVANMSAEKYIGLAILWLDFAFAGGAKVRCRLEPEYELPDLTYIGLAGQHLWWLLHLIFPPLDDLYRRHIGPLVRLGDVVDIPLACCFTCAESFAMDFWIGFCRSFDRFMTCVDRYVWKLFGLTSYDDLKKYDGMKEEDVPHLLRGGSRPKQINNIRTAMLCTLVPPIPDKKIRTNAIKDLGLDPSEQTYFIVESLMGVQRFREKK